MLRAAPLFVDLDEGQLRDIDGRMRSLAWAAGNPVYMAGEPAEYFYVIADGKAKSTRTTREGQDVVLDVLGPGDLFGGMHTLGQPTFLETVTPVTTVCGLRIGTSEFREVLEQYPPVALRVLEGVSTDLSLARMHATEQATGTVRERVAAVLLRLGEKFGEETSAGLLIQVPLSRSDIAGLAGSTTESVSRAMSEFRKAGLIDSGRKWTAITDLPALQAILR